MSRIGIIVNAERDVGLVYLKKIIDLLNDQKIEYRVSCCDYQQDASMKFYSVEECFDGAELVLTLGGDGTLLRVASLANRYQIPLLGINLGHLGFLAEMEKNELKDLPRILKNGYECTERMMLSVNIIREGKSVAQTIALNDAVIRSRSGKPAQIEISDCDGELIDYFCDGFIIYKSHSFY
jgi:NAD+ kinase